MLKIAGIAAIVMCLLFFVDSKANAQTTPDISGGFPVEQGDHPWSAYVKLPDRYFSGTLINNEWILTAAHGISNTIPATEIKVQLGGVQKYGDEEGKVIIPALYKVPHELFDRETGDYDLGLIKLSRPISVTDSIRPIGLYTQTDGTRFGIIITGTIIGWGMTENGNNSRLRAADVVYICRLLGKTNLQCNSPYTPNIGVCPGDTGSTFLVNELGLPLLRASTWGGNQCDAEQRFNNFSYITPEVIDWIDSVINSPKYVTYQTLIPQLYAEVSAN